jgi:protein gp37
MDRRHLEPVVRLHQDQSWLPRLLHVPRAKAVWREPQRIVDHLPEGWPWPHAWLGVSIECREYLWRADILRSIPAAGRFLSLEPLLEDLGTLDLTGIGWVIVGGESGRNPRPMRAEWVRSIRDQCLAAGVPFFFKQWGGSDKAKGGRILDCQTWDDTPW